MNAKRCDRCYEFYVPSINNTYYCIGKRHTKIADNSNDMTIVDLCPDCYAKLDKWMSSKKKVEKEPKPSAEENDDEELPF